jgi:hypothetical protein
MSIIGNVQSVLTRSQLEVGYDLHLTDFQKAPTERGRWRIWIKLIEVNFDLCPD